MSEFDSPWKEILHCYLRWFLEFFFPDIAADIDWERGYETLDKELAKIIRAAELGNRLADKLFKVWRKNGEETWVLIHVEVQGQPEIDFEERMYVYNYRAFDRYHRPVASLAILADERDNWRPDSFGYDIWGSVASLRFRTAKLLDFAKNPESLESADNPFGMIVLAHLQAQATRKNPQERCNWKIRLVKELLSRGLTAADIRRLFRFIDWVLELPEDFEIQFENEIDAHTKEANMQYISTLERRAMARGREEGREKGRVEGREEGREEARALTLDAMELALEKGFGPDGARLMPALRQIKKLEELRSLLNVIRGATTTKEIEDAIENS